MSVEEIPAECAALPAILLVAECLFGSGQTTTQGFKQKVALDRVKVTALKSRRRRLACSERNNGALFHRCWACEYQCNRGSCFRGRAVKDTSPYAVDFTRAWTRQLISFRRTVGPEGPRRDTPGSYVILSSWNSPFASSTASNVSFVTQPIRASGDRKHGRGSPRRPAR
jgi:hypothetical protein